MSKHNDGGPAFPIPAIYDGTGCGIQEGSPGLSLRDWFAGQVLAGLYAASITDAMSQADIAEQAFRAADAMMKAREYSSHD